MSRGYIGICQKCGYKGPFREGSGLMFHLLHCDRCGKERSISFDKVRALRDRYVKGLQKRDRATEKNPDIEPQTEEESHEAIEGMIRRCRCGGGFRISAPPRCPKCRSAEIKDTGEMMFIYD